MLVDFNLLPDNARIWIYQSDRYFSEREMLDITNRLENFVENWKRHGEDLKASFQIRHNQFIVFGVDENYNNVSGCSIDASVHIIKQIEKEFNLELLNKMNVAFRDGDNINTVTLQQFKAFAKQKKVNKNTFVFNNMVSSKGELTTNWEVKAANSWHVRFLN